MGKLLGTGTFGAVFACRHKVTGERFAMKRFPLSTMTEARKVILAV